MKIKRSFLGLWIGILIVSSGGLVMPAFSMAPPLTEEFLAETLPSTPERVYTSSPEGRIEIAYDDTDFTTQFVPISMPLPTSSLGGDRHRGNYYACTTSGLLVKQGIHLDRTAAANVTFFVYESLTETGTYTLLSSTTVSAGIGTGIVQSAAVNIPMDSGKFYLLGAAWDSACTYYYSLFRRIGG